MEVKYIYRLKQEIIYWKYVTVLNKCKINVKCWVNLVNEIPMHDHYVQEGVRHKNIINITHVFCTCIVWCQLKYLNRRWSYLWHICLNVRPFRYMIEQMSEHSLMGNYSLIGCCTLILWNIIDRRYVVTVIYSNCHFSYS